MIATEQTLENLTLTTNEEIHVQKPLREALRRCLISRGRNLRGDGSAFFEQETLEVGTRLGDWLSLEAVLRPSDTLRPELDQAFAVQV